MNFKKTLMKKIGIPLRIAGLLMLNPEAGYAQEMDTIRYNVLPERQTEITLPLANPQRNSDANSTLWSTINDLSGQTISYAGQKIEDQNHDYVSGLASRMLELGASAYTKQVTSVASHELGHGRAVLEEGGKPEYSFDAAGLTGNCEYKDLKDSSPATLLKLHSAGSNQDSKNLSKSFEKSTFKEFNSYQNALERTVIKLTQMRYMKQSSATPQSNLESYIGSEDYINLAKCLNEQGYKVSPEQFFKNEVALTLLNPSALSDLYTLARFGLVGERESKTPWFGDANLKIALPYISHLFAEGGEIAKLSIPLEIGNQKTLVTFSKDLDKTQKSADADTTGLGAKFYDLPLPYVKNICLHPELYLETSKEKSLRGSEIGLEVDIKAFPNYSLGLNAKQINGRCKTLEAEGYSKGLNLSATAKMKF